MSRKIEIDELNQAVIAGHSALRSLLSEADLVDIDTYEIMSLLETCISEGLNDELKLLLDHTRDRTTFRGGVFVSLPYAMSVHALIDMENVSTETFEVLTKHLDFNELQGDFFLRNETPITLAIKAGRIELVELFVKNGISVDVLIYKHFDNEDDEDDEDSEDGLFNHVLNYTMEKFDKDDMFMTLTSNLKPGDLKLEELGDGVHPLLYATMSGRVSIVKRLLELGVTDIYDKRVGTSAHLKALDLALRTLRPTAQPKTIEKTRQAQEIVKLFGGDRFAALRNKTFDVNVKDVVTYMDMEDFEEKTSSIEDYIGETRDNVVFMYRKSPRSTVNDYFFTKVSILRRLIRNTDNTFLSCKKTGQELYPRMNNINVDVKYFSLKSAGFVGGSKYTQIDNFLKKPFHQLFCIFETGERHPSFVGKSVLDGGEVVSALHCQEGHDATTSIVLFGNASDKSNTEPLHATQQVGTGKRKNKKTKRRTRKHQRKNKTIKRTSKHKKRQRKYKRKP